MAVTLISPERAHYYRLTRFNPIRNLTPEVLNSAIDSFYAGGLRNFALIMDQVERRDDKIKTAAQKRKASVSRLKWEIVTKEGADEGEATAHKDALKYFYDNAQAKDAIDLNVRGGIRKIIEGMMDAASKYYAVHELLMRPEKDGLTCTFNFIPLWYWENRYGKLRFLQQDFDYEGVEIPESQVMVSTGPGLMEASCVAYMYKKMPLQAWLNYCEMHGSPGIQGKTKFPKGSEGYDAIVKAVSDISQNFSCVTNLDDIIDKIDLSQQGELPYPKIVDLMNRAVVSLWLGADLSTMSGSGHQSSQHAGQGASVQDDALDILVGDDAERITETFNEQVDPQVIEYAFGPGVKPLAYFKLVVPEKKNIQADIATDEFLLSAGAPLGIDSVLERYGRPKPDADEELLKQPASPLQLPGQNGTGNTNGLPSPARPTVGHALPGQDGSRLSDSQLAANESAASQSLIAAALKATARAQGKTLKPLAERIKGIIELIDGKADGQVITTAVKKLHDDLPAMLTAMNADSATAAAIEKSLSAAFFNGVIQSDVRRHMRGVSRKPAKEAANEVIAPAPMILNLEVTTTPNRPARREITVSHDDAGNPKYVVTEQDGK